MIYEVDELLRIHNLLIEIIKRVAMPAEKQLELHLGCITDELALDFCEIGMSYIKILYDNMWIDENQYSIARDLNNQFGFMSNDKTLWEYDMLNKSDEWKKCRHLAGELLEALR